MARKPSPPKPAKPEAAIGSDAVQRLLVSQMQDAYSAETQALEAYPAMLEAVTADSLRKALESHADETKTQVDRLERALGLLDSEPGDKHCQGMHGLIEEAREEMQQYAPGPVLDVVLLAAAQRLEHYEIAGYGTMATLAEDLGEADVAELLEEILDEEKAADKRLSHIADDEINAAALGEEAEEGDDEDEDEALDGEEEED